MNKIFKIDNRSGRIVLPRVATSNTYSVSYDLNSSRVFLESTNPCSHHHK